MGSGSVSDFTLGELIGEGGFGRVYECLMDDGRICAAKVVPLLRGRDTRTREAAQKEIEGEVLLMQRLTHPNIVAYFGTKTDDKSLYIFMELVPGGRSILPKIKQSPPRLCRARQSALNTPTPPRASLSLLRSPRGSQAPSSRGSRMRHTRAAWTHA